MSANSPSVMVEKVGRRREGGAGRGCESARSDLIATREKKDKWEREKEKENVGCVRGGKRSTFPIKTMRGILYSSYLDV